MIIVISASNARDNIYCKKEVLSGVYVWGYYDTDVFIPLYVGKSKNLYERALQHYCRLSSGEYRLFNPDDLHDIYVTKTKNVDYKLEEIYTPYAKIPKNSQKFKKIQKFRGHHT